MPIEIRGGDTIHAVDGGWFRARWHFSFSHYRDPQRMGVGPLRVFNDDRLAPGAVWPMHPHQDVESLTYVVEGRFGHADSLGYDGDLLPGAAQVMTFGPEGAEHSERNLDPDQPMRFLQFWILPDREGLTSGVQQRQWHAEDRTDRWLAIMSPHGEDGLDLHQDARVSVARLTDGRELTHETTAGRGGYLYVLDGRVGITGEETSDEVGGGDAVVVVGHDRLTLSGRGEASELWLADVPLEFEPHGIWARLGV